MRRDDSHHDAQHLGKTLIQTFEGSAETREAFVPVWKGSGLLHGGRASYDAQGRAPRRARVALQSGSDPEEKPVTFREAWSDPFKAKGPEEKPIYYWEYISNPSKLEERRKQDEKAQARALALREAYNERVRMAKSLPAGASQNELVQASGRAWEQGWTQKGAVGTKQDFLEADPYYSKAEVPVNTYKAKAPYTAKVVAVNRMVGPKATGETCHIIIDHGGKMPYYEGQSYGVIAPVTDPKTGKPAKTRLYSIASSRYGDDMTGNTASLCVRRATYWCPEMQAEDPAKKGVCSNFLCDAKPGDEVQLTGPSGKVMLMPEEDPNTDLIMIATGTGIAPYRGFIRRNFLENTPACDKYSGLAWLFLGVANSDGLLYDDEFQQVLKENPNNFRVDYALSREGDKKMYIQDKVAEYGSEIFDRMDKGAHLYMCGLKGMLPGVTGTLQQIAESKGQNWDDVLGRWKKGGQWHIEVY